jgi:hypothetical protein
MIVQSAQEDQQIPVNSQNPLDIPKPPKSSSTKNKLKALKEKKKARTKAIAQEAELSV